MPVNAPDKKKISDDEILNVLGPPSEVKVQPPVPPPPDPRMTSIHDGVAEAGSGISLLGAAPVKKQVACTLCGHLTSPAFAHCPRCGTPLPREVTEKPTVKGEKPRKN